jgi:hypothetical protein
MRQGLAPFVAVLASAITAAVLTLISAWVARPSLHTDDIFVGFFFVLTACFIYSMFVGLPIALVLVHKHRFRAGPMLVAGALAGLPAILVLLWPGSSANQLTDWAMFAGLLACGSAIGAASGAAFFLAHHAMSPNNSFKPNPHRGGA